MRARDLLDGHRFTRDARFIDEGVARQHRAVDRYATARRNQDRVAHREFLRRDRPDRSSPAHGDFARQEFEQVANGLAAAANRQPLQHLGDEDEERDDECGEELADRRSSGDGDRHRQLHRHAPLDDILECLLQDRPAADQKAGDADDADSLEWLPDLEPDGRRRDRDKRDPHCFRPFERVVVIVAVLMIVVLMIMMVMRMRMGLSRMPMRLIGKPAAVGGVVNDHGANSGSI